MTGLFNGNCPDCNVRAVAQGPQFHDAQRVGRFTSEYRRVLTQAIGGDLKEAHDKVKAFHEKVKT